MSSDDSTPPIPLAVQPYAADDFWGALPISEELKAAARAARTEAAKPGRDRRYQIHWVPITLLVPAAYNPRIMPDADAENLQESLEQWGMVQPLVVNTFPGREGVIVGGHQRLSAALGKRWTEVGLVWVHVPLAEEQTLNLALNRIHGMWDEDKLAEVIHELADSADADDLLALSGFAEDEIEELLASYNDAHVDLDGADDEEVPPVKYFGPTRTKRGELWALGRHLLLVGDARDLADVAHLYQDDALADCVWTDPPYGVNYVGKTKDALTITNDGADDLDNLLSRAFAAYDAVAKPGAPIYVCEPAGAQSVTFRVAYMAAGWRFHETLVWVKDSMVLGHSDYHVKHETLIFGYKPPTPGMGRAGRGGINWYGDDAQVTTFEVPRPKSSQEHPTMKPLTLVCAMLLNSTRPGDLVADHFGGSGTTLMACEKLGRVCRMIEFDPRYADVILTRFTELTGIEPVLVGSSWGGSEETSDTVVEGSIALDTDRSIVPA